MLKLLKNNQGAILNLFFKDPSKEYYLREIARFLGKEPGYYQKIINNLVKEKILLDERKGNLRLFKLNTNYPLYIEIKNIVSKTIGVESKLKELINKLNEVESAFLFGSIANNQENINSDIDLMLIGQVNQNFLTSEVVKLENKLAKEINYHIYSKQEIINKINEKNSFFINIFNSPIILLKGNLYEFTKLAKQ